MSESKKKTSPYENSCGPFKRWNQNGIFHSNELTADITNHVKASKV